jgi:hypothetical protein
MCVCFLSGIAVPYYYNVIVEEIVFTEVIIPKINGCTHSKYAQPFGIFS